MNSSTAFKSCNGKLQKELDEQVSNLIADLDFSRILTEFKN